MGRTPLNELNCNVSSESLAEPEGHPRTVLRAKMSCSGVTGHRFRARSDDEQFSVRPQSINQGRDRFGIGRGGQNHVRAAKRLQTRAAAVVVCGVDVIVRAELLGQRFFVSAAADRNRAKTHLARVLNAQMAQAADALDRHQFAGASPRHCAKS